MAFCAECGCELQDDWKNCPNCGTTVTGAGAVGAGAATAVNASAGAAAAADTDTVATGPRGEGMGATRHTHARQSNSARSTEDLTTPLETYEGGYSNGAGQMPQQAYMPQTPQMPQQGYMPQTPQGFQGNQQQNSDVYNPYTPTSQYAAQQQFAPLNPQMAQSGANFGQQQPNASTPSNGKTIGIVIGCVVVGVVVIIFCIMLALGVGPFSTGNSSSNNKTQSTVEATTNANANSSTNANANNTANQSSAVTPSFQGFDSINEGGTSGLSASNADDCYTVNLFLSNFTEKGKTNYQLGSCSTDDYANWAYYHCLYNDPDCIETSGSASDWSSTAKTKSLNARIASDTVAHYVSTFYKVDIDPTATSSWIYVGGYNYFIGSKFINPAGVAHTTAISSLGNGRYQVTFDVYGPAGGNGSYDVLDETLYSATASELMARFGLSAPRYSGTAVIEEGYDGIAPFKLISITY